MYLLKACRNFISKYNKGRQPLDTDALDYWEEYIANNTYFGSLLKPIFDIKTSYQKDIELQTEKLEVIYLILICLKILYLNNYIRGCFGIPFLFY